MGSQTKIQWTDHTFNPWRGCTKVAPGCANCYAESQSKRNPGVLGVWGPQGSRVAAVEKYWKEPEKWNEQVEQERDEIRRHARNGPMAANADQAGHLAGAHRRSVFCASLADVFEDWQGLMSASNGSAMHVCNECGAWRTMEKMCHGPNAHFPLTMDDCRRRLFELIDSTPNLDWLILTKRPQNVQRMWPIVHDGIRYGHQGSKREYERKNVWLLTSISDQATADEYVPHLLECRDLCPVLGLSVEPLLGPVDFTMEVDQSDDSLCAQYGYPSWLDQLNWVIVGGESGPNARPCRIEWIRDIVQQCEAAEVPCFVKQLGRWPADLRIRQFPDTHNVTA